MAWAPSPASVARVRSSWARGVWRTSRFLLASHQRPIWVPAHLEPEFRRVVGEGLEMPRDQFVVARRRPVAPLTGLLPHGRPRSGCGRAVPRNRDRRRRSSAGAAGRSRCRARPGQPRPRPDGPARERRLAGGDARRRARYGRDGDRPAASHIRARRKSSSASGNGETPR